MLVVAELGGHASWGPGPWWPVFPILWLMLVGAVVVLISRSRRGWRRPHRAEDVLAERYAGGEITVEEYRERLQVLKQDAR